MADVGLCAGWLLIATSSIGNRQDSRFKRGNSDGREQYLNKRNDILTSRSHLIELDLLRPVWLLWLWCMAAAAAHVATDAVYWWGIQFFWPLSRREFCLAWIEYLDLFVLTLWLGGAAWLYFSPARGRLIAALCLTLFVAYLAVRAVSPAPANGSLLHLVTGGWMYVAPKGSTVLDWW